MKRSSPYRVQHQEIDALITKMSQLLVDAGTVRSRAKEARSLLGKLSGKLRLHLTMEDRSLYPDLLADRDPAVRDTARRFRDEMGPLGQAFFAYVARWPHEQAVAADPAGFRGETRDALRALAARMLAEDSELYPAADAASGGAASARVTTGR